MRMATGTGYTIKNSRQPKTQEIRNTLKTKLKAEGSELSQKLGQPKMNSADGNFITSKKRTPVFLYIYIMKTAAKKKSRYTTKDGYAYLTKRKIVTKAKAAGKRAAKKAMDTMGFVITTHNGWVVKQFPDGAKERISKIAE